MISLGATMAAATVDVLGLVKHETQRAVSKGTERYLRSVYISSLSLCLRSWIQGLVFGFAWCGSSQPTLDQSRLFIHHLCYAM